MDYTVALEHKARNSSVKSSALRFIAMHIAWATLGVGGYRMALKAHALAKSHARGSGLIGVRFFLDKDQRAEGQRVNVRLGLLY